MKIPGLDDISANMDKFAEMLPVLHRIADGVERLVFLQEQQQEWNERNGN